MLPEDEEALRGDIEGYTKEHLIEIIVELQAEIDDLAEMNCYLRFLQNKPDIKSKISTPVLYFGSKEEFL
jgi:hypothetical protein